MIWLLPIIVIVGMFYPLLGFLVITMMASLLTLSVFKLMFWCKNLCPRGAFLDIVLSRVSMNRNMPLIFARAWFRWLIFIVFMGLMVFRLSRQGANPIAIGAVFVSMCLFTTIISIILGIATKHRSWCTICPMGTLQAAVYKIASLNKHTP